jgi:hypothetical protein
MSYCKDERVVNVTNFAPILIKVKNQGCCVMKMKVNDVNTFLDESTSVFIMTFWTFLFLSF